MHTPEDIRQTTGRSQPPTPDEVDRVFGALAHEARRHIALVLAHFGPELPSGYVAKRFTHSWPTTTRPLHVLEDAGIVTVRSEGRHSHYRLERDHLRGVLDGWLGLFEPAGAEIWRSPGPRSSKKGPVT